MTCFSHPDASHTFVSLSDKDVDLAYRRLDVGKLAVHPELSYRLWVTTGRVIDNSLFARTLCQGGKQAGEARRLSRHGPCGVCCRTLYVDVRRVRAPENS